MAQSDLAPEEIESEYLKSAYVKELCVFRMADENTATDRLFAVVVPNLDLMRQRRIVNVGDLLRFEMEGQSIHLPPQKRIRGFEIWFEALSRAESGALDRADIERRVRDKRRKAESETSVPAVAEWSQNGYAENVVKIIARRANGRTVCANANLEIDLGLDSMDRIELITELEQELGLRLPQERAHYVLTVKDLLETLEPIRLGDDTKPAEDAWAVILRDLPADAVLSPLFEHHSLKALFYAFLRALRLTIPTITVTGLEHLPPRGPYIISPNHQSYLDPFFICSALPYRAVRDVFAIGAAEYFETPVMAWVARQLNLVAVDPDANLVPAMKAAAFGLNQQRILMLFPEGERSIDGAVKRFKKGAAILSRHLGIPIVPVAIRGAFDVWPRNRPFNWRLLLPWSRHRLEISFGSPMRFDDVTCAAGAVALQQRVMEMWESPEQRGNHKRANDAAGQEKA